jgi:hypothetical protein
MKLIFGIIILFLPLIARSFELPDKKLQECVNALAERKGWQDASQVRQIKCHNQGIKILDGLGQFSELEVLSLHKNNIEKFELEPLAKLKTLNIARNPVSQLQLNNFPQLKTLYAFDGELISLQLSNLPQLQQIKVNQNKLEEFGYENLPALEKITIFDNQLEHVDIYNLPALTLMDCRQNPMPDKLYEEMDVLTDITFLHDGNADDW